MAWTKTKTAVVTGAIILLTVGTSVVGVKIWRAANPPNLAGAWEGTFDLGDSGVMANESAHSRIVLRIFRTNNTYAAAIDLIDAGIGNFPLNNLVYDYPRFHAEANFGQITMRLDATVNFAGSKITGTAGQGNGALRVLLNRTAHPSSIPAPLTKDEYASPAGGLQGLWEGKLGQLNLSWKIAAQADRSYRAELDNHQVAGSHQPVRVIFKQSSVELRMMSGSGMFEGKLSDTQLIGDWIQGGMRTPVTFSRVDLPSYNAIPDNEPEIAERIRKLKLEEFRPDECTPEYWQEMQRKKNPAVEKALAEALGELKTITLVERTEHAGRQSYRYRIEYEKMNVIYHIGFERGKIALAEGTPE